MVDAGDPPAELGSGQRLHRFALELVEPRCQRTAHHRRMVQPGLDPADPDRGINLAARRPRRAGDS